MIEHFTASDGASLAFKRSGSGPALLCLAGLSRNSSDFDYVWPHLNGVTAIAMDYRGRGKSDWTGHETYIIPREAQDALELLDFLCIEKAAILGTSRGGLIAMGLAAFAKHRLSGVLFNDVGPVLETKGLDFIKDYIGKNPAQKSFKLAAKAREAFFKDFTNVPRTRWLEEVQRHFVRSPEGLTINYDPDLAIAVAAAFKADPVDLWPFFDALADLPTAALRGENSTLLSEGTFLEMQRRHPNMIAAQVPDRGHVPFLDEPASLRVINAFLGKIR